MGKTTFSSEMEEAEEPQKSNKQWTKEETLTRMVKQLNTKLKLQEVVKQFLWSVAKYSEDNL